MGAEVIESDEEEKWEEAHAEEVVQVLDMELVITGSYDPEFIPGKTLGTDCMSRDR